MLNSESRVVRYTPASAPQDTSTNPAALPFSADFDFNAGDYVALYLIQEGASTDVLSPGPGGAPAVFFSFPVANVDGFDHYRYLDFISAGAEDLTSGGDLDFNDGVVRFDFPNAVISTPGNRARS